MNQINSSYPKGRKGPVRKTSKARNKKVSSKDWYFQPKLRNEGIILYSILNVYSVEFYNSIVADMRNLITSLIKNHGFSDGPKRYGIIKNYTIDLIEMREPENPGWLATSEVHRIPSKLGINFIQLIVDYMNCTDTDLSAKYYQVILSLVNINRAIEGLSPPEFDSVVEKAIPIDEVLLRSFDTYVSKRLTQHKYDFPEVNLFEIRFNLKKNGPNGLPKIETAHEEAICLVNSKLNSPFKHLCEELRVGYLYDYLLKLREFPGITQEQSNSSLSKTILRKLVSVPDSGFKTRIVAIVDFWTQLIMVPIRNHVRKVIEIEFGKTDFTKSHDDGVNAMQVFQLQCLDGLTVNELKLDAKHLKFYDISSWTDRFHRDLQKVTMKHLFTPRLAEQWSQLVVHCDWYAPDLKRTVKYGQGQGMGTNGSFDIATLTDHLLINYLIDECSQLKGVFPNNACYGKVGDDLWIYDPENLIPETYLKINLPINFSKSKTFCKAGSIAEFCSRTFWNGVDVSRISPKVINRSNDFRYIPILLGLCANRGVQLDASSFTYLQNNLKDTEETYFDKLQDWILSILVTGKFEQSSYFSKLSLEYLEKGGWLCGSRVISVLSNPTLLTRLLIAHSVIRLVQVTEKIENLLYENVEAMEQFGDEVTSLSEEGTNLFLSPELHEATRTAMTCCKTDSVLLPKQIIVFGRYSDQRRLVQNDLYQADFLMMDIDKPQDILGYALALEDIVAKSSYDEGNINYDLKKVYSTQFSIVKTLERLNEDFTTLSLDSSTQIRSVLQDIQYDRVNSDWSSEIPLIVLAEPESFRSKI